MTSVDAAVEKFNEVARTKSLDDAFLKSGQASTKNRGEALGTTPGNRFKRGMDTRNIEILDSSVRQASQEI